MPILLNSYAYIKKNAGQKTAQAGEDWTWMPGPR
jgi:hypothetical protein